MYLVYMSLITGYNQKTLDQVYNRKFSFVTIKELKVFLYFSIITDLIRDKIREIGFYKKIQKYYTRSSTGLIIQKLTNSVR